MKLITYTFSLPEIRLLKSWVDKWENYNQIHIDAENIDKAEMLIGNYGREIYTIKQIQRKFKTVD